MKILVYEHVSGGGYAEKPIPVDILSEGFSMLRALVADFKAAGHSVSTVLDSRIAALNPPINADYTMRVSSFRTSERAIRRLSESVDAAYIIAPESNRVLQSLVARIEQASVLSLNCSANAIGNVSDKATMLKRSREMGVPTPATTIVNVFDNIAEIKQYLCDSLGFPLIVKPVDGVGCAGLSIVQKMQQMDSAVAKAISESSGNYFMVQEFIHGTAASVSLLATDSDVLPVSLNKQDVSLMMPEANSTYNGGWVPLDNKLKSEAFAVAAKTVRLFHGLRGYVGVDLVLTGKEAVLIEVNPRLTTSYVGLRQIVGFNPAQAIIDATLENKLPANSQSRGYAVFSKANTPKPTIAGLQETYSLKEIVSPPFPVSSDDKACALVLSYGATLKEAKTRLHKAKKHLHSIIRLEGKQHGKCTGIGHRRRQHQSRIHTH